MNMIGPMAYSLVGAHFPQEQRASALSWVNASMPLAAIIGSIAIGFIAEVGGWRWAFLGVILPISLLCFLVAAIGVPSHAKDDLSVARRGDHIKRSQLSYLEGFKRIISNKSATACLIGSAFFWLAFQAIVVYSPSLFRQRFLKSTEFATILFMFLGLFVFLGSMIGGYLINRFGKRFITVLVAFFTGITIIFYAIVPNLWLAMVFLFLGSLFSGIMFTASSSISLEQVPSFRGTMMSLYSAFWMGGAALGAGIGGAVLLMFDYRAVGLTLGTMSLVAAFIFFFLVIDPTSTVSTYESEMNPVLSPESEDGVDENR